MITPEGIPEDLRDFLTKEIDSIAQLEALLLLKNNAQYWTLPSIAARLYIPETEAAAIAATLEKQGLVEAQDDAYRFACKSHYLENLVDRLAATYREQLIPITNLIHSKQPRIQEFADAFKLRKNT